MKTILHEQRRSSIAAAAVTIALGLLLIGWPDRSIHFICMLLGAAIFLTGIIYFLGWLARRREGIPAFFVLPAVVLCALGIWLMTSPDSVILLIQYIFGAILIVHGIVDLQGAGALMRQHWNRWWADLLLAFLTIAFGALILVNPFSTFASLIILIGVALVFDGLSDLSLIWRLSRAFRTAERLTQEKEQNLEQ
ncbi:MAG: DUF308 domain-containing protein [Lawsonibacter sp.]|nr:DUF308 domain-containing protein [Lawsonibacter sp.]